MADYELIRSKFFLDGQSARAIAKELEHSRKTVAKAIANPVPPGCRLSEQRLNRRFLELRSWYLFDSRFCNVAKGNEKGHVENLVKRSQRTFLTPLPEIQELDTLNAKLAEDCLAELDRTDPEGQSFGVLWEAEKPCLLPLPSEAFPACQERSSIVDKQSLVQFDGHLYSVPVRWAYHPCVLKGFVDRVEISCQHQCVAVHRRSYGPERFVLEPRHYLPPLERKPGCLDQARPFQGDPWGEDFARLRRELEYRSGDEGTRQFIRILLLLTKHPEEEVRQAKATERRLRQAGFPAAKDLADFDFTAVPKLNKKRMLDLARCEFIVSVL